MTDMLTAEIEKYGIIDHLNAVLFISRSSTEKFNEKLNKTLILFN